MFANVATIPAAATSFIPKAEPIFISGLLNTLVIKATRQNAPANVNAIPPTISIPSVTGAIPSITVIPTNNCNAPKIKPRTATITTPCPKTVKHLIIISGANQRPKITSTAKITIGTKFAKIIPKLIPAAKPPAKQPKGIVTMPHNTPVAKY